MAATDLVTEAQIDSLATTAATAVKTVDTKIGALPSLATTDKTSVVAAINEVHGAVGATGAVIDDSTSNTANAWSGSKIATEISAATTALVDGAPGALDTLHELATALGDDANFSATVTTALANRVRVDAAQGLTAPQQAQALTNLGVARSAVDFAANFTAAL